MNFSELWRTVSPRRAAAGRIVDRRRARRRVLSRLLVDEGGQDLIEYALLAAFVGFAGIVGYQLIGAAMKTSFESWNNGVQDQWEIPPKSGY